jgi:hypothetical protein
MKLNKLHLFLLLLVILLVSNFGFTVKEYMENRKDDDEVAGRRKPYLPGVPTPRWLPGGGVPEDGIPDGDEDLYILKSKIVPPVCPKCPDARACPRQKPCPPCKPCGRCPEPSFECKKVPNYNVLNTSSYPSSNNNNVNSILPRPMLNNFSTFA